jgi:RNA-directed DNA polymerase
MRAVKKHASQRWMTLYIERWLKAPVGQENGQLVSRHEGTPQGGVIGPLLANLFLHYAFDRWIAANFPQIPFERYADDAIVHCRAEKQAEMIRKAIAKRLTECGLELHPEKARIIYCKDDLRKGRHTDEKFDFLGYEFRPRESINRNGKVFTNFSPAGLNQSCQSMRETIRNWRLRHSSHHSLDDLSRL